MPGRPLERTVGIQALFHECAAERRQVHGTSPACTWDNLSVRASCVRRVLEEPETSNSQGFRAVPRFIREMKRLARPLLYPSAMGKGPNKEISMKQIPQIQKYMTPMPHS